MYTLRSVLSAVMLVGVAGCGGGGEVLPVPPALQSGFSGTWVRNADLSQNPQEAAGRGGRSGGGDAFAGAGGRGGGGGGRGGRGGAAGDDLDAAAMQQVMRFIRPAQRLILTMTDSTVEVRTGRRAPLLLTLDGEERDFDLGDNQTVSARAEWKGETLELRIDVGRGFSVNQSYSLNSETGRMEIEVSSRIRGRRIRTLQVYDRTTR